MAEMTIETLPDTNQNGIPDAFEHRRAISDILNNDEMRPTVIVEIETRRRTPRKGELFLCGSRILRQDYDCDDEDYKWPIVHVISGNWEDIEERQLDSVAAGAEYIYPKR